MAKKKTVTRAQILAAANDLPSEYVEVPRWGGAQVKVRALNAWQAQKYRRMIAKAEWRQGEGIETHLDADGFFDSAIFLAACGAVDEDDEPLLSEDEMGEQHPDTVALLAAKVRELTNTGQSDEEAEGN